MRKKKVIRKFKWERLAVYILSIIVILLLIANYKLKFTPYYSDEVCDYVTKIELVRK